MVRIHLVPAIGTVALNPFTVLHVEQMYARLRDQGVSARVRNMAGTVLGTALRHAARLRLIPANPVPEVAKPRFAKSKMLVLDRQQAIAFLREAKKDRLYALYVLAITTGMRQGELFALQWTDVDLNTGTIQVQRSLEEIAGKLRVKELKTDSGRRRIDLPVLASGALRLHRKQMLKEGYRAAPVFCDSEGGWLRKSNVVRRSFEPILVRANLPRVRFHDLRHTAASLLLLAGENPKVVSERLGHASV